MFNLDFYYELLDFCKLLECRLKIEADLPNNIKLYLVGYKGDREEIINSMTKVLSARILEIPNIIIHSDTTKYTWVKFNNSKDSLVIDLMIG